MTGGAFGKAGVASTGNGLAVKKKQDNTMASNGQIAIDHTKYGLGSMPSSINYVMQSLVILWPALALAAMRQELLARRSFRGEQQRSGFKYGLSIHQLWRRGSCQLLCGLTL